MNLEQAIRAALSGEGLTHLTLAPSDKGWQAAYKPRQRADVDGKGRPVKSAIGYRIHIAGDPIEALVGALKQVGEPAEAPSPLDEDDLALI